MSRFCKRIQGIKVIRMIVAGTQILIKIFLTQIFRLKNIT